ncbi:hypothetical protein SprV_0100027000 [Sparganum proliferum]
MSRFSSLQSLDLSKNNFGYEDVQGRVGFFARKRRPKISGDLLPSSLANLTNLRQLKMSSCGLRKIPPVVFQLISLRLLDISRNSIDTMPARIERLPAGIFNGLDDLRTLNLAKNALEVLPDSIGGLINLSTLDLTTNKLRDIKFPMDHLVKLYDMHSYRDLKRHGLWLLKNPLNLIRRLALHRKAAAARVFVMSSNHSMKVAFLSSLTTHFSGYQSFPPGIFINLIRRFSSQQKDPGDFHLLHQQTRLSSHHLTSPTGQRITFISLPFSPEPSSRSPAHARSNALFGHLIRPDSFLLVLLHLSSWQAEESEFENLRRTAYSYLQALQLRAPGALLQFLVLLQNRDHMLSSARAEIGGNSGRTEADYKLSPSSSSREVKLSTLMKRVEASVQSAIEDFATSLAVSLQPARIQIVSLVGIMLRPSSDSLSVPNDGTSVTRNLRQVPQTKTPRISLQNSKHSSLVRTMGAEESAGVFCRLQTLRTFLLHCERCFCVDEAYRPGEDICPPDWELALCRNQQRHRRLLFIPLERLEIDYHSGRTGSFEDLQTYLNAWTKLGRALWLERHHFLKNYVIFRVDTFCELASLLLNADSLLACYGTHLTADPRHFSNRISALADISVEETQLCFRLLHKEGQIPSPLVRVILADDIIELCTPLLHSKPRKSRTHRGRTRRRVASSLQSVDLVNDQEPIPKLRPLPNSLVEKLKEMLDLGFELTRGDASARHSEVSFFYTGANVHLKIDSQLALTDSADAGVKKDMLSVTAPKEILDIFFDRILTEIYINLRGATTVLADPTSNLPSTEAQKYLRRAELEFQNGSIVIEDCCLDETVSESWGEGRLLVSVGVSADESCLESTAGKTAVSTVENMEGGALANLDELLQKTTEDFRVGVDTFCELASLLLNADSLLACYGTHLTADPRHFSNRISALADISVEETQLCFRLLHKDGQIPSPLVRVLLADDIIELCTPLLHSKPRKSRTHRGRTRRRVASSLQSVDLVSDQEPIPKLRPLPNSLVEKLKEMLDLGFELTRGDASARHSEVSFFYTGANVHLKIDSQLALTDSADAGVKKDMLSVTAPKEILDIFFDRILTEIYINLRGATTVLADPTSNLPSTEAQKYLRRAELEFQNGSIVIEDCCLDETVSESWGEGRLLVSVGASADESCLESTAGKTAVSTVENMEGGALANLDELLQKTTEDFRVGFPGSPDLAAVTTND